MYSSLPPRTGLKNLIELALVVSVLSWLGLTTCDRLSARPPGSPGGEETREPSSPADDGSRPLRLAVTFEELDFSEDRGSLVADYDIERSDWHEAGDDEIALWLHVRIPLESYHPDYSYGYSLRVRARSGRAVFPEWLSDPAGDELDVCLLATAPGDNLALGRGYVCQTPRTLTLEGDGGSSPKMTFRLRYRTGAPTYSSYPWFHPFEAPFQPPMPDTTPAPGH